MNIELKKLIIKRSKSHFPFKRENDNKKYQEKYIEIFNYIYNNLPALDSSIHINKNIFKKIYRNYKQVLFDLYNDNLIYFCISSNNNLIHGNKGFSPLFKGEYKECFKCFYKLELELLNALSNNTLNKLNIRTNNKYNITNKIKNNIEYKQIKGTPNFEKVTKMTDNKWYKYLTDEDGNKIMDDLPHYGSYEDGRIYSKFHSLKREIRKHLLLCGSHIKEVFDISHCFPTLIGVLIGDTLDDDVVKAYRNYIMNNDIYSDVLEYAGLEKNSINRNKIKPYFNKFILSTIKDNKRNMKWQDKFNDPVLFLAVVNFFKNKFPEVFDFIWNYETVVKKVNGKSKRVKALVHDLQRIEKYIIDQLTSKLVDIPYLTLHDAIYIKEDDYCKIDFIFEEEFRKILNF